jgi:hypothetical protein
VCPLDSPDVGRPILVAENESHRLALSFSPIRTPYACPSACAHRKRLAYPDPEDQSQATWVIDTSEQLEYPSRRCIMHLFREKGQGTIAILVRSDPQELRLSRLDEA